MKINFGFLTFFSLHYLNIAYPVQVCLRHIQYFKELKQQKISIGIDQIDLSIFIYIPIKHKTFVNHLYNVRLTPTLYKCYTNVLCLLGLYRPIVGFI